MDKAYVVCMTVDGGARQIERVFMNRQKAKDYAKQRQKKHTYINAKLPEPRFDYEVIETVME